MTAAGRDGVTRVAEAIAHAVPPTARPVVLIDGRSGAGKSTLAAALTIAIGAEVVHLEDVYPGWDGLDRAVSHLEQHVLGSSAPRWQAWDWEHDRPADWHAVDPAAPLIVEGVGALSRAARARATFAVWVELDDGERRRRALERDGERYAPHWQRWADQEEAFIAREHPREAADAVVRSSPWSVAFIR